MIRVLALTMAVLSSVLVTAVGAKPGNARPPAPGDEVTVIAVIDSGITPYHWDFSAARMPQNSDGSRANDVSLDRPPHEWLAGFPAPSRFENYEPLELTLDEEKDAPYQALYAADQDEWKRVETSTPSAVSYYWIPGTKVIGAVDFGTDDIYGDTSSHGTGASSVAVGNLHGSCPECLLVFIDTGGFSTAETEHALEWAESQPWIDAVSNSYGHSTVFTDKRL